MKQVNSLLAIKYLSKGQKQNKVPNICWYNGVIHLAHIETAQFQLKASFLSLRCHFQGVVTHQSGQLKWSTFWPLGGNDALITCSRYITSKQLCEQYLKTAAPVMGCKGAGCAESRRFTGRSWQLGEHDPALQGEKTEASLAAVSNAALTPSVLTPLLCWGDQLWHTHVPQGLWMTTLWDALLESPLVQTLWVMYVLSSHLYNRKSL